MKTVDETGMEEFDDEPEEGESEEIDDLIAEAKEQNERDDEEEKIKVKREMPRHSTEMCKCFYNPEELRDMSEEMARKIGELDEKEAAKKAVAAQYKADIEAKQKEINDLAQRVRNKFEYRDVKLYITWDWEQRKVIFTRSDTGEVHRERAMTVDELQTEIDLN